MAFEITPVVVGSGLPAPGTPAEPVNTTTFALGPPEAPGALPGTPPQFLQWMDEGVLLGGPDVLIVNFVSPLLATRGVGEHENVITVRRALTDINILLTGVEATGAVGDLGTGCAVSSGPFLLRDNWEGTAQSASSYTHDTNTIGAPNWSVSGTAATDGAGHLAISTNSSITLASAQAYPLQIGFTINALSTDVNADRALSFSLSTGVEGFVRDTAVELFFPFTENSHFLSFDWDVALGKEVILEYVSAGLSSHVNVYICGTLIGAISTVDGSNQMGAMSLFQIGCPASAGPVYLDYLWLK